MSSGPPSRSPLGRAVGLLIGAVVAGVALAGPVLLVTQGRRGDAAFGDLEQVSGRAEAATLAIAPGAAAVLVPLPDLAPGDDVVVPIDVTNVGSLDLRYSLEGRISDAALADLLVWDVRPIASSGTCDGRPAGSPLVSAVRLSVDGVVVLGDPATGLDPGDRVVAVGGREVLCATTEVPLEAGNEFQGLTAEVEFVARAEQHTDGGGS